MRSTMSARVLGASVTKPNEKGDQYLSVIIAESAPDGDQFNKGLRVMKVSGDAALYAVLTPDPNQNQFLEFENRQTKDKYGNDSIKPFLLSVRQPQQTAAKTKQ